MSYNLDDILSQVKQVEETKIQKEKGGGFKGDDRILTLKKNCSYTVRFIPYIKDVKNTFVTYNEIGFPSRVDGKYVFGGRSPTDAGLKVDPYKDAQWKHFKKAKDAGDEVEQKASYKLLQQRKQLVNGYLVAVEGDDSEAKEKIGKNIVVRYPAQLDKEKKPISDIYKRITDAVFGDMSKKIGTKAFDLTSRGKSFVIKVTEKAGYNNYAGSYFDDPEDIGLKQAQIDELVNNAHDLIAFIPEVKPVEDIKKILDEHWYGNVAAADDELDADEKPARKDALTDDDTDIPMGGDVKSDDGLDELLKDD